MKRVICALFTQSASIFSHFFIQLVFFLSRLTFESSDQEEWKILEQYVQNGRVFDRSLSFPQLTLVDAFRVEREGENERFEKVKNIGNRILLWHGSRVTNYVGILSQGLCY